MLNTPHIFILYYNTRQGSILGEGIAVKAWVQDFKARGFSENLFRVWDQSLGLCFGIEVWGSFRVLGFVVTRRVGEGLGSGALHREDK